MTRQCFPCTACCEGWLSAKIDGVKVNLGAPCMHCTAKGCANYENRPVKPCRTFKCGWLAGEGDLPDHMKPTENDTIILFGRKWHDRDVVTAMPTKKTIPKDTLEWLMAYTRTHLVPLLYYENIFENGKAVARKRFGFGPPSFIHAVKTEIGRKDVIKF
jgi:hypothetical protein